MGGCWHRYMPSTGVCVTCGAPWASPEPNDVPLPLEGLDEPRGLAAASLDASGSGADSGDSGPVIGTDHGARPAVPPAGLTTEQFANAQKDITEYARTRITGIGHTQYDEATSQRFEQFSVSKLGEELLEELADAINYTSMIYIQIDRAIQRWREHPLSVFEGGTK